MRVVLHDWFNTKCKIILQHTMDVMGLDSLILMNNIVTPNKGINWQVSQIDLTMIVAGVSMECTEQQWQKLYNSVGLKIMDRAVYTPGMYETVTALKKA